MRLLIYSRTRLFSECVASGLSRHARVEACRGLWERDAVVAALETENPSALIVDLSGDEGWQSAQWFNNTATTASILGLSVDRAPQDLLHCAQVGCVGVIPYKSSIDQTVAIVARALRGVLVCSPEAAAQLMRAVAQPRPMTTSPEGLTRREGEVCALVCEGLTNKEIARELHCSQGTVKNHVHNILSKLNLPRRSAMARAVLTPSGGPPAAARPSADLSP